MKRLKYEINNPVNKGTEENPIWKDELFGKDIPFNETNEKIAKREAYGEITPYDDGQPEPEPKASTDEVLNILLGVAV